MLDAAAVKEFIDTGYTVLRGAFDPQVAADCRLELLALLGLPPDDPTAWDSSNVALSDASIEHARYPGMIHLRTGFGHGPFTRVVTDELRATFDQLVGPGRWHFDETLGWWPVLFPGFSRDVPPTKYGWHVDGDSFHSHLRSPEKGVLTMFYFSDVGPGEGGTAILPGSYRKVARIVAEAEPEGMTTNG